MLINLIPRILLYSLKHLYKIKKIELRVVVITLLGNILQYEIDLQGKKVSFQVFKINFGLIWNRKIDEGVFEC